MFIQICQVPPEKEDALRWENIRAAAIREENSYGGVRVQMTAKLGQVRIPLQFDIGFGDIITPGVRRQEWAGPLDYPSVPLMTYPMETVVAEKLEAAVSLGINNSRMKDFFDLHWLQSHLDFDGCGLTKAVTNTFHRRSTPVPVETPVPFTGEFISDPQKLVQWNAFLRKGRLAPMRLEDVVLALSQFLLPVLRGDVSDCEWTPAGHWQTQLPNP